MAAVLIQQSSRIETRIDFQTHSVDRHSPARTIWLNQLSEAMLSYYRQATFFVREQTGRTWDASTDDILSGLRDDGYRPCIFTGGMRYNREQTAQFCIE